MKVLKIALAALLSAVVLAVAVTLVLISPKFEKGETITSGGKYGFAIGATKLECFHKLKEKSFAYKSLWMNPERMTLEDFQPVHKAWSKWNITLFDKDTLHVNLILSFRKGTLDNIFLNKAAGTKKVLGNNVTVYYKNDSRSLKEYALGENKIELGWDMETFLKDLNALDKTNILFIRPLDVDTSNYPDSLAAHSDDHWTFDLGGPFSENDISLAFEDGKLERINRMRQLIEVP